MSLWELQANAVFDTDKRQPYLDVYERALGGLRGRPIDLLELGVDKGGSLQMWSAYFIEGRVFGFDLAPPDISYPDNVRTAAGDQGKAEDLEAAIQGWGVDRFDIVIDDASHLGHLAAASFAHLFGQRLKPGGLYIIEDWGTGYWDQWPDGEAPVDPRAALDEFRARPVYPPFNRSVGAHRIHSHQAGMVGFVKFLIDVMATPDSLGPDVSMDVASIEIHPGVVVVRKADASA